MRITTARRRLNPRALTIAQTAAAALAFAEVSAQIRSTAVDLTRAAELVAGAPDELPTEELLLLGAHEPELALA